jgi:hypothetical protein
MFGSWPPHRSSVWREHASWSARGEQCHKLRRAVTTLSCPCNSPGAPLMALDQVGC